MPSSAAPTSHAIRIPSPILSTLPDRDQVDVQVEPRVFLDPFFVVRVPAARDDDGFRRRYAPPLLSSSTTTPVIRSPSLRIFFTGVARPEVDPFFLCPHRQGPSPQPLPLPSIR